MAWRALAVLGLVSFLLGGAGLRLSPDHSSAWLEPVFPGWSAASQALVCDGGDAASATKSTGHETRSGCLDMAIEESDGADDTEGSAFHDGRLPQVRDAGRLLEVLLADSLQSVGLTLPARVESPAGLACRISRTVSLLI